MTPLLLVVKCSGDPMLALIGIMRASPDAAVEPAARREPSVIGFSNQAITHVRFARPFVNINL
jgi:hypothetical protein